jgi:hypothetical protein
MAYALTLRTLRRLDVQGFDGVAEEQLAGVAPWLRTDICVPSMMYRALFRPPRPRSPRPVA